MIELPGQPLAERILSAAVEREQPPQQLLLFGPAGSGKRAAARRVAWRLMDPDGSHDPSEEALDLTVIAGTGQMIRLDEIDPALRDLASRPFVHRRRVLIIEAVTRLKEDQASRLLKTLEEPAARAHLILVTDRIGDVIPTIRSRCLPVPFRFPGWRALREGRDPFVGEMEDLGVELGAAVMGGEAAPDRLVANAQRSMAAYAEAHPSEELRELRAEVERLAGGRGTRTAEKRVEDQAKREARRAITDGWQHVLDGWAALAMDALSRAVGADRPARLADRAEPPAEWCAPERAPALLRMIDELQLTRAQLDLNPTADLAVEALIVRVGDIGTARQQPLLPAGRII